MNKFDRIDGLIKVNDLSSTERGGDGFGSTGKY